ncbi:hypothetical protein D3C84_790520 [compost metagenome]
MKLRLPALSALRECQNSSCSLPGELDWPQVAGIMSKSRERRRLMYWETSTRRICRSMPSSARLRLNGRITRSRLAWAMSISNARGLPSGPTIRSFSIL